MNGALRVNEEAQALAQAQARQWFVRLNAPDCTADERADFERWRRAHPRHEESFVRVERLMGRVAELREDSAIKQAALEALSAVPAQPRARWALWSAAAAVGVLFIGAAVYRINVHSTTNGDYTTARAQQRAFVLQDGSQVLLDADTRLEVRYGAQERAIDLRNGRAQFVVAQDTDRPFVVYALSGKVKALGTRFQTRILDGAVTVTLMEGRVAVEQPAAVAPRDRILKPGEQLVYNDSGTLWNSTAANLEVADGWPQGKLVFKDQRLADLVAEVNRYSTQPVRLLDPSVENLRISAIFKADDSDALILALQEIWSIDVHRSRDGEILISRR